MLDYEISGGIGDDVIWNESACATQKKSVNSVIYVYF